MAILAPESGKPKIHLRSPGGNAMALLATARSYARQFNKDPDAIVKEMRSGDFENLINVFDREFGEYVDLIR